MSAQLSENDELVLGPWGGAVAGLLVGGAVAALVAPQAGLRVDWATAWLPWLLSAILGSLYGACQLRVPIKGLLAVGIFYGVFLWILTNLVGWLLFPVSAASIRSWTGFGMFILFSAALSGVSVAVTLLGGGKGVEKARH